MYRDAGREDRAAAEEAEAAILTEFLPAAAVRGRGRDLVRAAIAETGAACPADLGRVMGALSPRTKGRADGRLVSETVRRQLAGQPPMFIPRTLPSGDRHRTECRVGPRRSSSARSWRSPCS